MSEPDAFCEHLSQRYEVVSGSGYRKRQNVVCNRCGAVLATFRMKTRPPPAAVEGSP